MAFGKRRLAVYQRGKSLNGKGKRHEAVDYAERKQDSNDWVSVANRDVEHKRNHAHDQWPHLCGWIAYRKETPKRFPHSKFYAKDCY